MGERKRKLAVFDIDGTVFRSSLLIELNEALIEEKIWPANMRRLYAEPRERWFNREGTYEEYIAGAIRAFDMGVKRVSMPVLLRVARAVIRRHGKRVYRFTRDLAREMKRKGYFLLAISHSPKLVLDPFCKQLGFDKVYGRVYEHGEGGRLVPKAEYSRLIADKAKILRRAVDKEGLTLRGSVGVGDSEADVAFLEMVERPICFNPNSGLCAAARRHGWPIVVERKDVIYDIRD